MTIDVVMCSDRKALLGMAVSGRSALEHASETVNFWIVGQDFTSEDKKMLRTSWEHAHLGSVSFVDISSAAIEGFRSTAYLKSKMTYARYFIADFFPDISRCVYLDVDLLVMRDVAELMHLDLGGNAVAACRDIAVRSGKARPDIARRLGLKDYGDYFNSGVMLMDLAFWRANGITKRIVDLSIEKEDSLDSQDQDALNITFEGKVHFLDTSWNTSQYEKPDPIEGKIVHLVGPVKPWNARYQKKFVEPYYRDVIYDRFFDVVDRTAFRGTRPWNPLRLGEMVEYCDSKIPTLDMVAGKLRRLSKRGGDRAA